MLCEKCQKQEAQVHFTEVKNKQKVETHLCNACAETHPSYIASPVLTYSVGELMNGLNQVIAAKNFAHEQKLQCPDCLMEYASFHSKGRLGCAKDYKVFRKKIKDLLQKVHGSTKHIGKVPKRLRGEQEIVKLHKRLEAAIREENYEEAAKIRDEIKEIEAANHND